MEAEIATKIINQVIKEGSVEAGIFISILSYNFITNFGVKRADFLKSLKNSLKTIDKMYKTEDE